MYYFSVMERVKQWMNEVLILKYIFSWFDRLNNQNKKEEEEENKARYNF